MCMCVWEKKGEKCREGRVCVWKHTHTHVRKREMRLDQSQIDFSTLYALNYKMIWPWVNYKYFGKFLVNVTIMIINGLNEWGG